MVVTEFGMLTKVRLEQPSKALPPILVTELGISMEVNDEQPRNAR